MAPRDSSRIEPDDLIRDREVDNAQSDRLAHSHIAEQLNDVALSVPTPTNIAVWGPWGSGKSGVANLLKGLLEKQRNVRFVRFDAFKYAENPLRRNFIIAAATALGIKDAKFHEELYGGRAAVKLQFEKGDVRRLLKMFAWMFGAVVAFFAAAMAFFAWLHGGAFRPTFANMAAGALKAGLAPAALLTSLMVLVSRTLTREHKTEAADSDEQFEKLFADLVKRSRVERLVVFVDELDRCKPSDVVATLDALRTFLGVGGCVFVVAADQQVLEEALTRALEQATPTDAVNPYYSSGSGYLDKVFQYQLSLPPLLVPKVTSFAADLVRGRGGVWATVDVNLVVSVLVPSHVRSPRRVKALLNTFVLTYRLAQRRAADGLLEIDPATRVEEIAKLVCLRVEFPLFARDLLLDHRLCAFVLALDSNPEADLGFAVSEQAKEAARRYANLDAAVDQHLSVPEDPDEIETEDQKADDIRKHHGQQLVAYLKKTRIVPGPGRDLIFMETSGSVFGLPSTAAETLEQQAQNAELDAVLSSVGGLPAEDRSAALALLLQQARDAIGLEEENVAHAVLAVCGDAALSLNGTADTAVETLTPILTNSPHALPDEVLPGCWRLALASDRPAAIEMRTIVLRHSAVRDSASTAAMVMRYVESALTADPGLVQQLVSHHLLGDEEDMAEMLAELPPSQAAILMEQVGPHIAKELRALIEKHEEWERAQDQPAAVPSAPSPEPRSPDEALRRLEELLEHWCEERSEAAHSVVGLLLASDSKPGRDIVEQHADNIPTVRETALARAVLSSSHRRSLPYWPAWLGLLDPRSAIPEMTGEFNTLLKKLWTLASSPTNTPKPEEVDRTAGSLMRLFDNQPPGQHPHITPFVLPALSRPSTDEEAGEQLRLLDVLQPLENSGLLERAAFVRHQAAVVTELLTDGDDLLVSHDSAILTYIESLVNNCLRDLVAAGPAPLNPGEARALVNALDHSDWLPGNEHTRLRVRAHHLLASGGIDRDGLQPLPTAAAMADHARKNPDHAGETLAAWITLEEPSASELLKAVSAGLRQQSPTHADAALLQAVASRLAALPTQDQAGFWKDLLAGPGTRLPTQTLTSAGWPSLPDAHTAELLIERYDRASRNPDRRAVLDLWRAANVTNPSARRDLIQTILLPMLEANQGAAELAIQYLPQLMESVPKGMGKAVRETVEASGKKWRSLDERGIKALTAIGYRTERTGLLRTRRISRSNDT
ncbi:P-loop NTPase fold protein [Streptomyces coacervatus]|uniref:KAP family P-loop NTPase fold protein n=1 Tax=Streptomyces coacervatus TaxID=647381 RepID=UPI0023DBEEA8|nr:P-loop NTPase fold protein [Streptomyces coacervatus]MDF2271613.1 P-loop NTPase fold protein [Streptomyces coacervatus]